MPMTNIRKESFDGLMIVLLMVVCFIIGCVSHFFQDVSFFFSTVVFELIIVDFELFLPLEDKFFFSNDSGHGTVSWLLGLDRISYDHFVTLTYGMLDF